MFQIHYCDYNAYNPDKDIIYRPKGSGDFLFLLLMTPMKFHIEDTLIITKPNACMLYTPDTPQHYQAVNKFKNSYIHFYVPYSIIESYKIPVNRIFYPHHYDEINELIKQIQTEHISKEIYSVQKMSILMEDLLITIARSLQHTIYTQNADQTLLAQFQAARLHVLTHCEENWNTETMSQLVNLSKSQFYYYYKTFFNNTPKNELIEARIEKAKYLLTNEALQVQQVAHQSGFHNIYHFTRYFNRACGCTPTEYARKFREQKKQIEK